MQQSNWGMEHLGSPMRSAAVRSNDYGSEYGQQLGTPPYTTLGSLSVQASSTPSQSQYYRQMSDQSHSQPYPMQIGTDSFARYGDYHAAPTERQQRQFTDHYESSTLVGTSSSTSRARPSGSERTVSAAPGYPTSRAYTGPTAPQNYQQQPNPAPIGTASQTNIYQPADNTYPIGYLRDSAASQEAVNRSLQEVERRFPMQSYAVNRPQTQTGTTPYPWENERTEAQSWNKWQQTNYPNTLEFD
ncbi:hypothetical protein FQN57_002088 [Myotisia sp. PD_48]|nr:hypothetical protein FQN57_002088 [Myotisia sp. PD_48]